VVLQWDHFCCVHGFPISDFCFGSFLRRTKTSVQDIFTANFISQRSSVEVLNRHVFQVNSFEAANIDCGYPIALWIGALCVRLDATRLAKAVLDDVLVERVRADVGFRFKDVELIPRHKPQKRSFAGTHGTIACRRSIEFAFCFEHDLSAVTATLVLHVSSPWFCWS
jgi:hypothetical protein